MPPLAPIIRVPAAPGMYARLPAMELGIWSWRGFPGGSVVKNLPANAGDMGSIPESGRSPGAGNGNPLPYSS